MSEELKKLLEADAAAQERNREKSEELRRKAGEAESLRSRIIADALKEARKEADAYRRMREDEYRNLLSGDEAHAEASCRELEKRRDDNFEAWVERIVDAVINGDG